MTLKHCTLLLKKITAEIIKYLSREDTEIISLRKGLSRKNIFLDELNGDIKDGNDILYAVSDHLGIISRGSLCYPTIFLEKDGENIAVYLTSIYEEIIVKKDTVLRSDSRSVDDLFRFAYKTVIHPNDLQEILSKNTTYTLTTKLDRYEENIIRYLNHPAVVSIQFFEKSVIPTNIVEDTTGEILKELNQEYFY